MKLSENLKIIRKDNNLSQEQLAEKLGVSRQAVSKWESDQSYPEMDKVLLICKLFNYKIDELMNENVKDVEEAKQSKNNINKFIDDFLGFITKTVDMFSAMKFWQKIKCILEQLVVATILACIFFICGEILLFILGKLIGTYFYYVENFIEGFYLIFSLIAGITILLHIFKIRYLDYYEIVKIKSKNIEIEGKPLNEETEEDNHNESKKKIFLQKEKEKIIIRDPEHSQSKFLTGLMNLMLWFIKTFAVVIEIGFSITFIGLVAIFILNFLFIKTGMVFIGGLLGTISGIIINFVVLELIYNFIFSKKSKRRHIAILLIASLICAGIGIGLVLIGIKDFNYSDEINIENFQENEFNITMKENLSLEYYTNINYIESNSNDVKITVNHSKYSDIAIYDSEDNTIGFYTYNFNIMRLIRDVINDINNKKIKNYQDYFLEITVYTSKENIEKLKQNRNLKYQKMRDREEEINNQNLEIQELQNNILELERKLEEKDYELQLY